MTDPKPLTDQQLADIEAAWRLGDTPSSEMLARIERTAQAQGLLVDKLMEHFYKGTEQE